jgi:streptomycin 6-kinase
VPRPDFRTPSSLAWLRASPEGRRWLDSVPALLDRLAERWRLTVGEPYPYAFASVALRVRTADGTDAVLKLQFPDRESAHEATALRAWDGHGAVRLLAEDADRHALLLERCEPGSALLEAPAADRLDVLAALLPRLWVPAPSEVTALADEAAWWLGSLERSWATSGRTLDRELLDAALLALVELPATQGPPVLLDQDLHTQNVLRAGRQPWLVIDPKPLAGEREFGLAPVLRDVARWDRSALVPALDRLTDDLGLDRDRARRWALAQTVAWGLADDGMDPLHAEIADLLHRA